MLQVDTSRHVGLGCPVDESQINDISLHGYQSSTAQQDHEDDECLKVVVLNNQEAGFPEVEPHLPSTLRRVHVQAGMPLVAL